MSNTNNSFLGSNDVIRGQIEEKPSGKLEAPENIITTIQAGKNIYYRYRSQHIKRIALYSHIEGLLSGNPPYNPQDLAKHGLSHIANFNPLDARAMYEKAALAYWNLLNQAERIAKFTLDIPDTPDAPKWADIMAHHFNRVVRKWKSFNVQMNMNTAQLVKFGVSSVIWPDERDWRWRTISLSKFYVADQAQTDIEQITAICVESTFTAQYLFGVYETYKDSPKEESPWDIDELSRLLLFLANTSYKMSPGFIDMYDLQLRLQNGDITFDNLFSDSIPIVSLLYKEYDEKISHYMFHPTFDSGNFLFFADRQYDCFQEAIVLFTASPGEETIHSNRGVGHKIFAPAQAMMQLDCSIVDMAKWSSTPMIRGLSTGAKDFETIRFYPGVPTNIGSSEFVQNQLGGNINQLIGASQYLLNKMQFNSANSGDDPSMPDSNIGSLSNDQARLQSYKEFGVLKNNIAHYYTQCDQVIQNMVIKMLDSKPGYPGYDFAKEWIDSCIEDGVPEIIFQMKKKSKVTGLPQFIEDARATRVAGDGSTAATIMGLQELMPIASSFGPKAAEAYNRRWIMATVGQEYVDEFTAGSGVPDENAGGASLAGVENAIMEAGKAPIFSMDNEHRAHIVTHLALATATIRSIQMQQTNAIEADKIFTVLIPHIGEHYNAIKDSPFARAFIGQVENPINQVSEYARLNRKNAQSMLQAELRKRQALEEQNQTVQTEEQLKTMQAVNEEKRKDFKVQSQVQRAAEANENRAQVMREKNQLDAETNRQKNRLEASTKNVKEMETNEIKNNINEIAGETPAPADIEK